LPQQGYIIVTTVIIAGWSSNSGYSLLGGFLIFHLEEMSN